MAKKSRNSSRPIGCLMAVVGFFVLGVLIKGKHEPVNAVPPGNGTETHARAMAWQFIESAAAPLTVDHEWGTAVEYNQASQSWIARGSFTTNNGQFRRRYTMRLRNTGGDSWTMDDLTWLD